MLEGSVFRSYLCYLTLSSAVWFDLQYNFSFQNNCINVQCTLWGLSRRVPPSLLLHFLTFSVCVLGNLFVLTKHFDLIVEMIPLYHKMLNMNLTNKKIILLLRPSARPGVFLMGRLLCNLGFILWLYLFLRMLWTVFPHHRVCSRSPSVFSCHFSLISVHLKCLSCAMAFIFFKERRADFLQKVFTLLVVPSKEVSPLKSFLKMSEHNIFSYTLYHVLWIHSYLQVQAYMHFYMWWGTYLLRKRLLVLSWRHCHFQGWWVCTHSPCALESDR